MEVIGKLDMTIPLWGILGTMVAGAAVFVDTVLACFYVEKIK